MRLVHILEFFHKKSKTLPYSLYSAILIDEQAAIDFLQDKDEIKLARPCKCGDSTLRMNKDKTRRFWGFYVCKRTNKKISLIKGTVLERLKVPANEFLRVIYLFVMVLDTVQSENTIGISRNPFLKIKDLLRELLKKTGKTQDWVS